MTSPTAQQTDFSIDVIGRYVCNGLDEALRSADPNATRPGGAPQHDARPFDIIILGGGSFGGTLAQKLLYNDVTHSHRILVLDAGRHLLPEHVQNLPMLGLVPPGPATGDPGTRALVWGLPWQTNVPGGFPGLAYCIGGRSLFFGGWSPELLEAETTTWPTGVLADLRADKGYFAQASDQIGVSNTNDFIFGKLHEALRKRLYDAVRTGKIDDAVPFADLPQHLHDLGDGPADMYKLEAPLAVQGNAPRSGFFPINKFSSVPLMIEASRAATAESGGDDVKKRLMIVPNCHILRLVTTQNGDDWKVVAVETSLGTIALPPNGVVIVALGTIESARLALTSFPSLQNSQRIGRNLMAHLRSNLTIRIPRTALPAGMPNELAASALFLKGRHKRGDNSTGHFHLQITAAGLDRPTTDTEPELFKKIPSLDFFTPFLTANDDKIVITLRGIGEMLPNNGNNRVTLSGALDEYQHPRAFVSLAPVGGDNEMWDAMDHAADQAALIFANGKPYEVLVDGGYQAAAANQSPIELAAWAKRRDGIGTTHHECGTLAMGTDATVAVTNSDARFHFSSNTYVAGPALFPTIGSPNPMLTGVALARRLADHIAPAPQPFQPEAGFTPIFNGFSTDDWRMTTIRNQPPERSNPGGFIIVDGSLETTPGNDLGMLWYTKPMPANYILRLQWLRWEDAGNSGVFVRFPNPNSKGYDNTAYVAVNFGFEVQIDELGAPDGLAKHKTGAIYDQDSQTLTQKAARPAGQWNDYEIRVDGQTYTVLLNGDQVTKFVNLDAGRGIAANSFVGLQSHFGSRVAFRHIRFQAL
jgi:choline dehydrogenase-like flavoprotein